MSEQIEAYDSTSEEYKSGHRCGSTIGTFHRLLELLHWDINSNNFDTPRNDWEWGLIDAYEKRSGKHIVERT